MQPLFTELLDLPGIDVEDDKIFDDKIILEVEAHAVRAVCPRCQTESTHLHQNHGYFVRDLSLMGRSVWLKVNRRQFKCAPCGKPFSEELDFVGKQRKHTHRFAEMIVGQEKGSSALKCIVPWEGLTDVYRDVAGPGGVTGAGFLNFWWHTEVKPALNQAVEEFIKTEGALPPELIKLHPVMDSYWESKAIELEKIEVPMLVCGSFSDHALHTRRSHRAFERVLSA
jgi:transposase-like protein